MLLVVIYFILILYGVTELRSFVHRDKIEKQNKLRNNTVKIKTEGIIIYLKLYSLEFESLLF